MLHSLIRERGKTVNNYKILQKKMSNKIVINKRIKGLPREELEKLSKEQLIDKIIQLEAYNFQLKNILQKKLNGGEKDNQELIEELRDLQTNSGEAKKQKTEHQSEIKNETDKKSNKRKFDFSRYHFVSHSKYFQVRSYRIQFVTLSRCYKRHVLLKFLYFGWDYKGFAAQEDSNATIGIMIYSTMYKFELV